MRRSGLRRLWELARIARPNIHLVQAAVFAVTPPQSRAQLIRPLLVYRSSANKRKRSAPVGL
eukprot:6078991-Amphidinium_carterae.1